MEQYRDGNQEYDSEDCFRYQGHGKFGDIRNKQDYRGNQ